MKVKKSLEEKLDYDPTFPRWDVIKRDEYGYWVKCPVCGYECIVHNVNIDMLCYGCRTTINLKKD